MKGIKHVKAIFSEEDFAYVKQAKDSIKTDDGTVMTWDKWMMEMARRCTEDTTVGEPSEEKE